MRNNDIEEARRYHESSSHTYESIRTGGHFLNWAHKPSPFKRYQGLQRVDLPQPELISGAPTLQALSAEAAGEAWPSVPAIGLRELGYLLFFSAGITRSKTYPGGEQVFFRAASCTGALYEIDLYVACEDLPDLDAGLYHFDPLSFSLERLRKGDCRKELVEATGDEPHCFAAPLIMISTGTYWRNAWKYRERTYRHFGWDNGTILANLFAVCRSLGLPAHLVLGYVDDSVDRLLGLDTDKEVSLSVVPVGKNSSPTHGTVPGPALRILEEESGAEVDYRLMKTVHSATRLLSPEEVLEWRSRQLPAAEREVGEGVDLTLIPPDPIASDSIERTILRRGSSRSFSRSSVTDNAFAAVIRSASRPVPADFTRAAGLNDWYLLVHDVDGIAAGAYFLNRSNSRLELLRKGSYRREGAFLALEQELGGDAAFLVFFLADLDAILGTFGNRGYRAVQLEAGIYGGRIYLAAYSVKLGATGLTFYDDEVIDFFSPHAKGKSAIFLMAVGQGKRVG
jgi:SagB-type dehydrogenase family enzyme